MIFPPSQKYEGPILCGREPDASDEEHALGSSRSAALSTLVNDFILRRTNTLLSEHLPPKVIEIVCCAMSSLQEIVSEGGRGSLHSYIKLAL